MTETTSTPTPTETRQDTRKHAIVGVGSRTDVPGGMYVVCSCSGDDTGYGDGTPIPAAEYVTHVLAAVSAAAPDEREALARLIDEARAAYADDNGVTDEQCWVRVSDLTPLLDTPLTRFDTEMKAARATREYQTGASFDVPADAVETFTRAVVHAALAARPAPTVNAADVRAFEERIEGALDGAGMAYEGDDACLDRPTLDWWLSEYRLHFAAALGLTVADGRSEVRPAPTVTPKRVERAERIAELRTMRGCEHGAVGCPRCVAQAVIRALTAPEPEDEGPRDDEWGLTVADEGRG